MIHDKLVFKVALNEYRNENKTFKITPKPPKNCDNYYTDNIEACVKLRMDGTGPNAKVESVNLHTVFVKAVNSAAKSVAFRYKYNHEDNFHELNFSDYYLLCCQVAKSLIKLGVEPRHSICLAGFNSPPWLLGYFGAIFCGAVASGVYTTNTAETVLYILNNCHCQVAIVESEELLTTYLSVADQVKGLQAIIQYNGQVSAQLKDKHKNIKILSWTEFILYGDEVDDKLLKERLDNILPNECCSLIYTSGTTGNPKGVMMSHDNLTWTARSLLESVKFQYNTEQLISYLPLSHVAAQMCDIILPLYIQGTVHFAQPDALKGSLGTTLKQVRPTYFIGVPRVFEKIQESMKEMGLQMSGVKKKISAWAKEVGLKYNLAIMNHEKPPCGFAIANMLIFKKVKVALGLDRCKGAFSAAAPLAMETQHYFASLNIIVCEIYGMSECSGPQTVGTHEKFLFGSVGNLVPDFKMKLHKSAESALSGDEGEICMNGRHVFMGYLGALDKTKEVFDDGFWLHSGDVGAIDKNGYLFITGRIKELLITAGGENIAPVPIEAKLKELLPFVSHAIVVGDKKKFLTVLFGVKCVMDNDTQKPTDDMTPAAIRYIESKGYKGTKVSKLISDNPPAIAKEIDNAIQETNIVSVSRASHVHKWSYLPMDLSVGNGELGPTLKVKRGHVVKQYTQIIEKMYE